MIFVVRLLLLGLFGYGILDMEVGRLLWIMGLGGPIRSAVEIVLFTKAHHVVTSHHLILPHIDQVDLDICFKV